MKSGCDILQFQFHKGSIKTSLAARRAAACACFNSIKVRLRPWSVVSGATTDTRFNSIKVRLRQRSCERDDSKDVFQFHKGSIKTVGIEVHRSLPQLFQFHKGSIKTPGWELRCGIYGVSIP